MDLPVTIDVDIGQVRREVQRLATAIGFDSPAIAELSIVATELATNLVRHQTVDGRISLAAVDDQYGPGIEIVSTDRGPGIADVAAACRDHYSTLGPRGCGLGAVRRLMDEFDVASQVSPGNQPGTVVWTRKRVQRSEPHFTSSVYSRPHPGELANGDSSLVIEDSCGLLIAVADGLGHGPEAATASQAAVEHIRENKDRDIGELIDEVHTVLHGTRGAALTIARVCVADCMLIHAGIGNVQARLYPRGQSSLVARPGTLGAGAPRRARVNKATWPGNGTLVIHTDGLGSKWGLDEELLQRPVSEIGHHLLSNHASRRDDATVVVARQVP